MRNRISLEHIRQYVFYQSIDFKTASRVIKLPPEKATNIKKRTMSPKDPKQSEPYPKPKVAMKPSKLKHKNIFKDIYLVLLHTLDKSEADEEPYIAPKSFAKIRFLVPKDPDPKEAHTATEKLMNT